MVHACHKVLCRCHRPQMMIPKTRALLQGESRGLASAEAIRQAKSRQQGGTVPVIAVVPQQGLGSEEEAASVAAADADGIAVPLDCLAQTAASFSGRTDREAHNPVSLRMADICHALTLQHMTSSRLMACRPDKLT